MFVLFGKMMKRGSHIQTHTHKCHVTRNSLSIDPLLYGVLVVTAPLFWIVIVVVAAGVYGVRDIDIVLPDNPSQIVSGS
jgi:hypothetical protein